MEPRPSPTRNSDGGYISDEATFIDKTLSAPASDTTGGSAEGAKTDAESGLRRDPTTPRSGFSLSPSISGLGSSAGSSVGLYDHQSDAYGFSDEDVAAAAGDSPSGAGDESRPHVPSPLPSRAAYAAAAAAAAAAGAAGATSAARAAGAAGAGSVPSGSDAGLALAGSGSGPLWDSTVVGPREGPTAWYREFAAALEAADHADKYRRLYSLARDFGHVAELYGKIIISEAFLPYDQKTIKPRTEHAGVAGGVKYLYRDIFFKFATDVPLVCSASASPSGSPSQQQVWMYGGTCRNDYKAMKAAKHELKSLMAVYNAHVPGLHLPLLALVTYRGFALIAVSKLPIDGNRSLRYGSDDAAATVHNSDATLAALMATLGRRLNLAAHEVRGQQLFGPFDIEGHRGRDGRYYLLDFARLMPPEATPRLGRSIFYHLLRPELVARFPRPLCPDVFLAWTRAVPAGKALEDDVRAASQHLHEHVITDFATALEREAKSALRQAQEGDGGGLVRALHRAGINCRHLGRVRARLRNVELRRLLLTEMVARVVKNELNYRLRVTMEALAGSAEEPYLRAAHRYLAAVLSRPERAPAAWDPSRMSAVFRSRHAHPEEYDAVAARAGEAVRLLEQGTLVQLTRVDQPALLFADRPVTAERPGFYVEVTLLDDGGGLLILGLKPADSRVLPAAEVCPGWADEYAYHSDSGEVFHHGYGDEYGPQLHTNDTLGMLWDPLDGTLQFTLNGQSLGVCFNGVQDGPFYPVLWLQGETRPPMVRTNFGARPFRCDPHPLLAYTRRPGRVREMDQFWRVELRARLRELFPEALSTDELNDVRSLDHAVSAPLLLLRLSELCQLRFASRVAAELAAESGFQLLPSDLSALGCKVDQLPLVRIAEAHVLLQEVVAGQSLGTTHALKLLAVANDRMDQAGMQNFESFFLWGNILLEQAVRLPLQADALLDAASSKFRAAVEHYQTTYGGSLVRGLVRLGDCLCERARLLLSGTEATDAFQQAGELFTRALADAPPAPAPDRPHVRQLLLLAAAGFGDRLSSAPVTAADSLLACVMARVRPLLAHDPADEEAAFVALQAHVRFLLLLALQPARRLREQYEPDAEPDGHFVVAASLLATVLDRNPQRFANYFRRILHTPKRSHEEVVLVANILSFVSNTPGMEMVAEALRTCAELNVFAAHELFTPETLELLLEQLSGLRKLELRGFLDPAVNRLVAGVAKHGQLRELVVRNSHLADSAVLAVVRHCAPTLRTLDLTLCKLVTDDSLAALGALTGLRKLRLNALQRMSDAGLEHVLPRLTGLTELSLCDDMSLSASWAQLTHLTNLSTLLVFNSSCPPGLLLEVAPRLTRLRKVLDVRSVPLSRQQLDQLCAILSPCKIVFQ